MRAGLIIRGTLLWDNLKKVFQEKHFDLWLANLVKSEEIGYAVHECTDTSASGHEGQERFLCVIAYGNHRHILVGTAGLVSGWPLK